MPSEKTTRQGQAWDQLAKDAYGDELRLGALPLRTWMSWTS